MRLFLCLMPTKHKASRAAPCPTCVSQAAPTLEARASRPTQGSLTPEQQQWLVREAQAHINPQSGAMQHNGWSFISELFAAQFGISKSPTALALQYASAIEAPDSARDYSSTEIQAILHGVNKVLASESKPPLSSLTMPTLTGFLQGRVMPDGTPWRPVSLHSLAGSIAVSCIVMHNCTFTTAAAMTSYCVDM